MARYHYTDQAREGALQLIDGTLFGVDPSFRSLVEDGEGLLSLDLDREEQGRIWSAGELVLFDVLRAMANCSDHRMPVQDLYRLDLHHRTVVLVALATAVGTPVYTDADMAGAEVPC